MTLDPDSLDLLRVVQASPTPVDLTKASAETKAHAQSLMTTGHLIGPLNRTMTTHKGDAAVKENGL